MSQTDDVLKYLKTGKRLTALEALRNFGCMRLASRISELRKQGVLIATQKVEVKTSRGYATVSEYWIYKLKEKK
jgi:hypothetical protein